ncbi:unannotated protein [freshwater metagenome]|uniref:Unannotated protein n=1 Tax=freshwater metagenome TaxID=449393 RepID=A0A6J6X090_9ZZZZ
MDFSFGLVDERASSSTAGPTALSGESTSFPTTPLMISPWERTLNGHASALVTTKSL